MLTKLHKILIGLFVTQLVLAVAMLVGSDESAAAREVPLLGGFDAAKVTRLQITSPGKPSIDLVKRGESWVLASSFDYPVATTKITDVLAPLAKMAAAAPMATQRSRHKQLRVADDEYERKVTLTADGKDTVLYIGGPAGARRTAVRKATDDRAYAVQGVSAYAAGIEPQQWVDTSYVRVPRDEVASIAIERSGSRLQLARSDTAWTATLDGVPLARAAGESLDTSAIDAIVDAASSINLARPGDPTRDASKPLATITIDRKASDNASVAPVIVDILDAGEHYWVRQRGVERAALVAKASLATVLDTTRDKLIKKPSTAQSPTP